MLSTITGSLGFRLERCMMDSDSIADLALLVSAALSATIGLLVFLIAFVVAPVTAAIKGVGAGIARLVGDERKTAGVLLLWIVVTILVVATIVTGGMAVFSADPFTEVLFIGIGFTALGVGTVLILWRLGAYAIGSVSAALRVFKRNA